MSAKPLSNYSYPGLPWRVQVLGRGICARWEIVRGFGMAIERATAFCPPLGRATYADFGCKEDAQEFADHLNAEVVA